MLNFGIYLNFTVAIVIQMANKIVLKQRNCHFGPNSMLLETDILIIRYQHSLIPKHPFNLLYAVVILIFC